MNTRDGDPGAGLPAAPPGDRPSPEQAGTPEEFMVRLRQLREWTGLTFRDLETRSRRLGDHLPRSTLASTLRRDALPRQEFVEALVRACGLDPAPWARARRRLAVRLAAAEPAGERTWVQAAEQAPVRDGSAPHQLPLAPPVLVGRDRELDQVAGMLAGTPVTVISGPAGAGKSAVGVRAAHRAAHLFPDGQLYVNLRGTTPGAEPPAPAEIAGVLLRSLGIAWPQAPADAGEATGRLRTALSGRRLLVLLDDVASAAQVRPLVPCCGPSAVILTSRMSLTSLDGSRHVRLDPLSHAEAEEVLERNLGAERVRAEPEAVRTLADLCGHLPLGLRIAAARLAARPEWPVRVLTRRLADERRRLDEFRVDDMDVRASLAVSFEDVAGSDDEPARLAARVLGRLADLPAGEIRLPEDAVLLEVPEDTADRALERLVDAGLVESRTPGCYRVSELVRLFALEQSESGVRGESGGQGESGVRGERGVRGGCGVRGER
ncbi:helix-turn-helix domain-containing protein [Actinomadura sp. HBU206391]|uniref:helix-turn-helix domain-containing protein n=1 Tax=Actinomadura sp. HBU206391 TaxID=2731692 RepID=UPI00165007D6|nr:helix-turn-helix domain-containing protein [Actinomadura sp. HBU206391]MBC6459925.1 helix-turn-helix domain-containing protein [Actinomadura sp. HBU206391]